MNRQHLMQIRNVGLPAAPRPAALQEQADNLPRVVPSISASRFHLYGQRRDWWLSHSTLFGSVLTTLRRLPPKHCHHSQVLVRPPHIHCSHRPQKRHEVENTSSLQDVSKQPLDQHASPLHKRYVCRIDNLLKPRSGCDGDGTRQPRQYLNQNGNRRTSKTCKQ